MLAFFPKSRGKLSKILKENNHATSQCIVQRFLDVVWRRYWGGFLLNMGKLVRRLIQ